jgi:hypothetical protein
MDLKTFKEGIIKDPEFGEEGWKSKFELPASVNPYYKKALKEGLFSDVSGAIGAVQTQVVDAAWPLMIGRDIIKVVPTKNVLEKFPKELRPYAWITGEAPVPRTGRRVEFQSISVDKEIECAQEWTESYIEDASWNVLAYQTEGIGRAIARKETELINSLYTGITATDLAGGAELTVTDGAPTWAQITALITAVERENFHPNVIAMNPHEYGGLMQLDQFISSLYKNNENMRKGSIKHTTLDITFVYSSLITQTLCLDIDNAAVMLLRRDLTTKPYDNPGTNSHGVHGSERIGLGVLRTKAVARGTN